MVNLNLEESENMEAIQGQLEYKFRLVFVLFTLTCTVSCEVCGAT